jgi:hypothetical protein
MWGWCTGVQAINVTLSLSLYFLDLMVCLMFNASLLFVYKRIGIYRMEVQYREREKVLTEANVDSHIQKENNIIRGILPDQFWPRPATTLDERRSRTVSGILGREALEIIDFGMTCLPDWSSESLASCYITHLPSFPTKDRVELQVVKSPESHLEYNRNNELMQTLNI